MLSPCGWAIIGIEWNQHESAVGCTVAMGNLLNHPLFFCWCMAFSARRFHCPRSRNGRQQLWRTMRPSYPRIAGALFGEDPHLPGVCGCSPGFFAPQIPMIHEVNKGIKWISPMPIASNSLEYLPWKWRSHAWASFQPGVLETTCPKAALKLGRLQGLEG